ncbi:MAG: GNAT family N-acetyltransferase [Rubrivivax sp.]|nr:MAG: GNAT family N-acetyltransferase [Rubrivivax sp.]
MTASNTDSSEQFDKFGLPAPLGGPPAAPRHREGAHHWVPIRDLHPRHRGRILDHLLSLNERDRYLRFGFHAPLEQLARYVASIDFKRDEVFGIFGRRLQLVAVAHLAAMPTGHVRGAAMEFGVSVLPSGRGLGLGARLFKHAITHARNRGASHLVIHALTENAPMLHIASKAGAVVERHGPDAEGWLKLPPDNVGTHLDSSLKSWAAEVIYRVKYWAVHFSDWLRMLASSAS